MMCTQAYDCLVCAGDKTHDFAVYVEGVLLHSKKEHDHGYPGFAQAGNRKQIAMEFRQVSLREAIAALIDGKQPVMENEAEVKYKARMAAEDKQLEEEMEAATVRRAKENEERKLAQAQKK